MKKLLSVVLALAMAVGLVPGIAPMALAESEADFTYFIQTSDAGYGAHVTGYSGGLNPIVPKQLGGADVVSVVLSVNWNDTSIPIQTLDVSACTALYNLSCYNNQLTELDVSKNTSLYVLRCYNNQLTSLDVSKNTALTRLYCDNNQLTSLDVSKNTALTNLSCYNNPLTVLDVSKNTTLTHLYCNDNQLTSLDVSKSIWLWDLWCSGNQLTSLDVSKNIWLGLLHCQQNQLTSLDVNENTSLWDLWCSGNQLTSLDVSKNIWLARLQCFNNYMSQDPDISVIGWRSCFTAAGEAYGNDVFWYFPQRGIVEPPPSPSPGNPNDDPASGIDYTAPSITVPASGTAASGFSINLTTETITIPDTYSVAVFSVDGGAKWKPVKDALSDTKFSKLLNKDLTLHLSDEPIDKTTKKPGKDATIVTFPKIKARPTAPVMAVNYAIAEDKTGAASGEWVLTAKGGTAAVKDNIEIGVASGKTVDEKGFGTFNDGAANGIPVLEAKKTVYMIRIAPTQSGNTYTAASKTKKISVTGIQKAPAYKVTAKAEKLGKDGKVKTPASAVLKVKANTYVAINGDTPKLYSAKADVNVLTVTGKIELWQAATAKKPATAKQVIDR